MLDALQEINLDNTVIGWYQSSFYASHFESSLILDQFDYQSELGKRCICLIIQPYALSRGQLSLKAVRLTDHMMDVLREATSKMTSSQHPFVSQELITKHSLTLDKIFETVPFKIRHNKLSEMLLSNTLEKIAASSGLTVKQQQQMIENEGLGYDFTKHLEKAMESLLELSDALIQEQSRYSRRRQGVKNRQQMNMNNRMHGLTIASQIVNSSKELYKYCEAATKKNQIFTAILKDPSSFQQQVATQLAASSNTSSYHNRY